MLDLNFPIYRTVLSIDQTCNMLLLMYMIYNNSNVKIIKLNLITKNFLIKIMKKIVSSFVFKIKL